MHKAHLFSSDCSINFLFICISIMSKSKWSGPKPLCGRVPRQSVYCHSVSNKALIHSIVKSWQPLRTVLPTQRTTSILSHWGRHDLNFSSNWIAEMMNMMNILFYNLFYLLLYYRPGSSAAVDICSPRLSSRPRREEEMLVNVASINQRQVR